MAERPSRAQRKLKVGVIFGGRSGEHEVSVLSARGIIGAMNPAKYEVVPIAITKSGRWLTATETKRLLADRGAVAGRLTAITDEGAERVGAQAAALIADPAAHSLVTPGPLATREQAATASVEPLDVVFPVLHGPHGEDGTVQGLLELAGVPYVGAGVLASAVGMDKAVQKALFRQHGLPVVDSEMVLRRDWERCPDAMLERARRLGLPCFVKPVNLGSSVGVHKAHDEYELRAAIADACRYDRKILVERAVDGREIEVSVLGNDDPIASVPGEIVPSREFYDYRAKYLDGKSALHIPAPIDPRLADEARSLAVRAFQAVDGAGMARVDFFLERDTERFYVNEVNTIPGFTPISMYPKLWDATGISYTELIDRLIQLALERQADKARNETSYQPE